MKKILTVLTIVALVASSAFAGFSGEASVGFGGNLDNGNYGFTSQDTNVKVNVDLVTDEAAAQGEGGIYASIKASLTLRVFNGEKGKADSGDPQWFNIRAIADITEAKVGAENWYVSILGAPSAPDYAKSAIDTYTVKKDIDKWGYEKEDYDENVSYKAPYAKTNGVEVGVMGFKAGVSLLGDYSKDVDIQDSLKVSAFVETPEFDFGGVKFQAAGIYSYNGFDKLYGSGVVSPDKGGVAFAKTNAFGASAKVGFENDTIKASVASDMGVKLPVTKDGKAKFGADVAANFTYDFVTVDAYYATEAVTAKKYNADKLNYEFKDGVYVVKSDKGGLDETSKKNILSTQAKFDLNSFDVPVAITASAKDLLHTMDFGVKAEVTVLEGLTLTAKAGYVVNTVGVADADKAGFIDTAMGALVEGYDPADYTEAEKLEEYKAIDKELFMGQWSAGLDVEYAFSAATVKAGVSAKNIGASAFFGDYSKLNKETFKDVSFKDAVNKVLFGMSASVETETLIPGATLSLEWADGVDFLKLYTKNVNEKTNFGSITAKCKIAF